MTPNQRSLAENILAATGYLASSFLLLLMLYGVYEVATEPDYTIMAMVGSLLTGRAAVIFYPLLIVAIGAFWLRTRLPGGGDS